MNSADKYAELGNDYHWHKARERKSAYGPWVERVLEEFPARGRGLSVLDIGCGDGYPASRLVRNNYEVHGVEPLAGPLNVARRKVPRATFSLDYPDVAFDYVLALESVEHMDDPALLVAAVLRCREYAVITAPLPGTDEFAVRDVDPGYVLQLFDRCHVTVSYSNDASRIYRITPP